MFVITESKYSIVTAQNTQTNDPLSVIGLQRVASASIAETIASCEGSRSIAYVWGAHIRGLQRNGSPLKRDLAARSLESKSWHFYFNVN